MHSSGDFRSDFVAELQCVDCGQIAEVDVRYDPETIQPWAYDCPNCGRENRPDLTEDDPDRWRDD